MNGVGAMKKTRIKKIVGSVGIALILIASFALTAIVRNHVAYIYSELNKHQPVEEPGEFTGTRASTLGILEFLATGIRPMISDLFWIKATTQKTDQIFEMNKQKNSGNVDLIDQEGIERTSKDDRELYDLISMVNELDPKFVYAYYFGSTILAWDGETTLAISMLEKGLINNQDSAMLASNLSFIYYYFLKDWEQGARYADLSYRISGKYSATPRMVAQFYAAGRNYDMALRFIADNIDTITDPDTKKQLEQQVRYLVVEKNIVELEKAAARFRKRYGRSPNSLEQLVKTDIIKEIPKDPFGGKYVIKSDGTIENEPRMRFLHYEKMRSYQQTTPGKGRNFVE
jgi:hypothetical protein